MADKVMSPEFRVSFASVFEARSFEDKGDKKFELTALFPKTTDLSALKTLARTAAVDKWGDKMPGDLRSPFRDGSEKPDLEGYADHIFVKMTTKQRPGVVDQGVQPIIEPSDFYSGCYARASVTAYAYGGPGTKYRPGVAFGLQNVQKLRDGDPFSGRSNPEEDFEPVATDVTGGGTDATSSDEDIFG